MTRRLTNVRWSVTLGKFVADTAAKEQPPWAEHQFSFAFTGLPPVESYHDVIDLTREEDEAS